MAKSTLKNDLIIEDDPLDWFFPGMARCAFFLNDIPDFYHLEFALNVLGDSEVIGTIIGSSSSSVLNIESFETTLTRTQEDMRYLVAMIHNFDDKPRTFFLDFLFDGQTVQRYDYIIKPSVSLTAYIKVDLSSPPPGPPNPKTPDQKMAKGNKKAGRKDK